MAEFRRLARCSLLSVLSLHGRRHGAEPDDEAADPRAAIAKKFPASTVDQLKASPIPGIYEFSMGADVAYVSADGRYFLAGDLYEIRRRQPHRPAPQRRAPQDAQLASESDMIVFSPKVRSTRSPCSPTSNAATAASSTARSPISSWACACATLSYPRAGPGHRGLARWKRCGAQRSQGRDHAGEARRGRSRRRTAARRRSRRVPAGDDLGVRGTPANLHAGGRLHRRLPAAARRWSQHLKSLAEQTRSKPAQRSSSFSLSGLPSHSLASAGARLLLGDHRPLGQLRVECLNCSWPAGSSSSEKIASTGHSGSHSVQSMHSSGSITRKFGPSWKQSTGQTSTQSVYLHLMQVSVTTKVIARIRS